MVLQHDGRGGILVMDAEGHIISSVDTASFGVLESVYVMGSDRWCAKMKDGSSHIFNIKGQYVNGFPG